MAPNLTDSPALRRYVVGLVVVFVVVVVIVVVVVVVVVVVHYTTTGFALLQCRISLPG